MDKIKFIGKYSIKKLKNFFYNPKNYDKKFREFFKGGNFYKARDEQDKNAISMMRECSMRGYINVNINTIVKKDNNNGKIYKTKEWSFNENSLTKEFKELLDEKREN